MSQDPPILLQALSQKGRPGLLPDVFEAMHISIKRVYICIHTYIDRCVSIYIKIDIYIHICCTYNIHVHVPTQQVVHVHMQMQQEELLKVVTVREGQGEASRLASVGKKPKLAEYEKSPNSRKVAKAEKNQQVRKVEFAKTSAKWTSPEKSNSLEKSAES